MLILQPPKADRRVPSRFERLVLSLNAASTVARLRSCLLLGCYQGQTVPMRSWWRGDSDGGEDGDKIIMERKEHLVRDVDVDRGGYRQVDGAQLTCARGEDDGERLD